MMSLRWVGAVAVAVLFTIFAVPSALAAGPAAGSIQGVVVDGTKGASLPSGLVARLSPSGANSGSVPESSAPVGPDGHFSFDNVSVDSTTGLQVAVDYAGATYSAAVPRANAGSPGPLKLTIYEPTTADDSLKIDTANWIVEAIDDVNQQVVVLETINLVNTGDHTYVGDHRGDPGSDSPGVLPRTLRLYLPQGANDFHVVSGLDNSSLLPMAGGYVDTSPVPPGLHQFAYSFRLVYADGALQIQQSLPYPAQTLRVLVPNAGLQLQTDKLNAAGTIDIQGRSYVVLTANTVAPNTNVTLAALGFPNSPEFRMDPSTMQTVGLAIVGIAVVAALALGLRPKQSDHADETDNRREIMLEIARLDKRRADGTIGEQEYDDERARRKSKLVAIATGADRNDVEVGS